MIPPVDDFRSWASYWFQQWRQSGYRDNDLYRKYIRNYEAANEALAEEKRHEQG